MMVLPLGCDGMVEDGAAADEIAETQGAYDVCETRSTYVGRGGYTQDPYILWGDFFGFSYTTLTYLPGRCRVHKVGQINNTPHNYGTNKVMSYLGVANFPQLTTWYLTGTALENAIDTCEDAYMLFDGYEKDNDGDPNGDHFISKVVYAQAGLRWNATHTAARIESCQARLEQQVASSSVTSVEMVVWGISFDSSDTRVASRVRWINPQ